MWILGLEGLSKGVFERRTSTGSEVFSLIVCLEATKFVLVVSLFSAPRAKKVHFRLSCVAQKHLFSLNSRGNILSGLSDPQNR